MSNTYRDIDVVNNDLHDLQEIPLNEDNSNSNSNSNNSNNSTAIHDIPIIPKQNLTFHQQYKDYDGGDGNDSDGGDGGDKNDSGGDNRSVGSDSNNSSKDNSNSNYIYDIIHIFDDLYSYGRVFIENNYINLSDNDDFTLVYPNIYIGNYSTSTNLELLKNLKISNIISVIPSFNPPFPEQFNYLHIEAYDDELQNMTQHFERTNEYIKKCLNEGGRILLHCMAGRSRSITVLIAFIISILKGEFNQSIIKFDNYNSNYNSNSGSAGSVDYDVYNTIEYKKMIEGKKSQRQKYVDSASSGGGSSGGSSGGDINNNYNNIDYENISRTEQEKPKLTKKELNFVLYKKQKMIDDISDIISKYNILKKEINKFKDDLLLEDEESEKIVNKMKRNFSSKILNDIIIYIKSHRKNARPNSHFINQLGDLLF